MRQHSRSTKIISIVFLSGIFFWSSLSVTQSQSISGPSFEDVLSLRSVGGAMISPDGNDVVFTVRTVDWKENNYDTEIWLAKGGDEPFQLTRTVDGSSTSPRWSPDGRWIAFAATRGEKRQIFVIRPNGGEAQAIT
ncbi:MAG: S9 family peptidase, partial [Bacteroidetes bacterium]